jgi:phosphopantetheinyl transferase (holo-ACP synthase)
MIIWKVADDSLGQKFALPYPEEEARSAIRKSHYQNSRMALSMALGEVLKYQNAWRKNITRDDLNIVDHHSLKNHPNLLVSLAHTRGMAAAACAPQGPKLFGVGIDCEALSRNVKESYQSKFKREDDQFQSPLHLWCAKEAAFKASSYYWKKEKTFVLKDISVVHDKFKVEGLGGGSLSFYEEKGYLICVAALHEIDTFFI